MISLFRAFLGTWAAKAFFLVLVAVFVLWGIGSDMLRSSSRDSAVATVGERKIQAPEFQEAFRRDLAQIMRMMGKGEPTPAIRRSVAAQSLERLVSQAALAEEVQRLGIVVPDDALRGAVYAMPVFQGKGGAFDRGVFDAVLRNNGITEGRFFELMRADLAQRQLLDSVSAGVSPPQTLLTNLYAYQRETRVGEVVDLPASAAAPPPAPSAEDLQRQYENNPAAYSAPAYRRIKLVVLSPEIVAKSIEVPDDEVKAAYEQHKSEYESEEQRAVEIIAAPDEGKATSLAEAWKAGADWAAMQKAASAAGATAVELDASTRQQLPSAELADAVFAAKPDTVTGPLKSGFGYQVFRVSRVVAGANKTFEQVRDEIRHRLALDRAADQVDKSYTKLDDALSAGTSLDDLPGDLGLAAVAGTLDAQGNTPDGQPAPIPGSTALRQAIVASAFQTPVGQPPRMIEGPDQSYYALAVEEVTEPKLKPLDEVQAKVREEWTEAQRKREQEQRAAKLMDEARQKGNLAEPAQAAGVAVRQTAPASRTAPAPGMAPQVQQALFRLKQGETTMVDTGQGFAVVRLAQIVEPDPAQDPAGLAQLREQMTRGLNQDVQLAFAAALRERAEPRVNRQLFETLSE